MRGWDGIGAGTKVNAGDVRQYPYILHKDVRLRIHRTILALFLV